MKTDRVIVKAHHAGLFSNINKVISFMELYPYVSVDWRSPECIYGTPKDGNVWEHLFVSHSERLVLPSPSNAIEEVEYPHDRYTFKNVAELYHDENLDWRYGLNEQWRKLRVMPFLLDTAIRAAYQISGQQNYATVMVRSHGHAGEQTSGKSQSLEAYAEIMSLLSRAIDIKFYLMCGDLETVDWMKSRFGNVVLNPNVNRADTRDVDMHLSTPQTVNDARHCLIDVLIASMGKWLIHPVSNMATAALYMNPNLKSIYLP